MGMYGAGDSLGPQLMAEIGDVRRFERKQSLAAFAEVDSMPTVWGEKCPQQQILQARFALPAKSVVQCNGLLFTESASGRTCTPISGPQAHGGKALLCLHDCGANKFLRRYFSKVMECFSTLEDLPPPMDMDSTGLQKPQ